MSFILATSKKLPVFHCQNERLQTAGDVYRLHVVKMALSVSIQGNHTSEQMIKQSETLIVVATLLDVMVQRGDDRLAVVRPSANAPADIAPIMNIRFIQYR